MRIRVLKTKSQIEPAYMGLKDLSSWAGIGLTKLREHIKSGDLPAYKVKGTYLVKLEEFHAWMERQRYQPDLDTIVQEVMEDLK